MIEELKELNEKFFELYARLDRYIEKMSEEQVRSMQEKMKEQYELEYELLSLKSCTETEREIERLKTTKSILVPCRWKTKIFRRKRQNYAQTLLDEEVRQETDKFFAACEAQLSAGQKEPAEDDRSEEEEEREETPAEPAEEAQEANPAGEEEENVSADETDRSEEKEEREEAPAEPAEETQEANPAGEEEENVSADETDQNEEDDGIDAEYEIT